MEINRREFLKVSAAGAAIGCVAPRASAAPVAARNGMPYRLLGKTGVEVSLLTLGGYHVAQGSLSEEESIRIMRTAVDEGVNFFDNAWEYNDGASEERMGKALKDGYRDKVFLMTKHMGRDVAVAQEQLETSLRRLDVDMIDLWQFHSMAKEEEPGLIYESGALEFAVKMKEQGKIRFIGFTGHRIPSTHIEMINRGFAWDTVQMPISICDHHFNSFEQHVMPLANEKGIGVIAMKTLGGSPGQIPSLAKVATARECLQYAMSMPVSTVASGIDSMEKLRENIETAKNFQPLSEEQLADLRSRAKAIAMKGEFEPHKVAWYQRA